MSCLPCSHAGVNTRCIKLVTGFRALRTGIEHYALLRLPPLFRHSLLLRLFLFSRGLSLRLHYLHLMLGLLRLLRFRGSQARKPKPPVPSLAAAHSR